MQIQDLFDMLVGLPKPERALEIARIRKSEPEVADAVAELLWADERPSLLDRSLVDFAQPEVEHRELNLLVKREIGPYRLVRLLGEGGMGTVYLAEQPELARLVAIKFLRGAWISPLRRARFRQEQQRLARLNHANIARIYDTGTLQDGTPWFVMEYVEGVSLTEYPAQQRSGLHERLGLIRQVAAAVADAHRHTLAHRDLKPSNILVRRGGEVKLLDFGIAKELSDTGDAAMTADGLRLLTPAYAAPEQLQGGETGVLTDVYALGILLHELFTGKLPLIGSEGIALKPSKVVRQRSAEVCVRLSREQWKELDVICAKALEPSPKDRYLSADAFVQDLEAFEEGRVLAARPRSRLYAFSKFVRRNWLTLGVTAIALLLLLTVGVVSAVRVTRARNEALRQLARANRLKTFTEGLFDGGDRAEGRSAELTTATLLHRGEIEAEGMRDDPDLQASMFGTLGVAYQHLGQPERADALLEQALAERRALPGSSSLYADSLNDLALLRLDQRRMEDAESLLRRAVTIETRTGEHDGVSDRSIAALGDVLATGGRYADSEAVLQTLFSAGRTADRASPQRESRALADGLAELADVHFYQGDYGRSMELNQRALGMYLHVVGEGHPAVAHLTNSLGQIALNLGRFTDAEKDFRRSLYMDERWYGPQNPVVAEDLTSLAGVLSRTNRGSEARGLLLRALAIQRTSYGEDHSQVAWILNELGTQEYLAGNDAAAESAFQEALAIWRKVYGEYHPFVGLAYANLTGIYTHRGQYLLAEQAARKALAVYQQTLPPDHLNFGVIHVKLGRVLLREGKYRQAEQETRKGYQYFRTHQNNEPSYLAGSRKDLIAIATAEHNAELLAELR